MKITPPRSSQKKLLIISAAVVLVAIVGYGAVASQAKLWPFVQPAADTNDQPASESSDEQTTATSEESTAKSDEESTASTNSSSKSSLSSNSNSDDPMKDESRLSARITSARQSGDSFRVRTQIDGVVTEGSCNLKLSSGEASIKRSAGIQALASTSTCKGFDVPVSSLPKGTWTVKVAITAGGRSTTLIEQATVR